MKQIIWSFIIQHDYFSTTNWGAEVTLSQESHRLMNRRGLLWKKTEENRWNLIAMEGCSFEKDDKIEIELRIRNNCFPYVTDDEVSFSHKYLRLEKAEIPSITYKFIFLIGEIEDLSTTITTEIVFNSKCKFIEYIFIFRDENVNRELMLEESEQHSPAFALLDTKEYMGKPAAIFRSTEKKRLKERGMGNFCLWEALPSGRRKLLLRHLPEPRPGVYADAPLDSVREIIYV